MGHEIRENWYGFLLNKYKEVECVYTIYDKKGNLLYIGETLDLRSRMINHFSEKRFSNMIEKIVFYEIELLNRKQIEYIMIDICKPI